jgi:hypothetical protein
MPCVGLVGANAAGTGRSLRNVPSSAYRRTHAPMPRFAKPSDVTTSSPLFVSVKPSGSRLNGAYGCPSGASRVVTPRNPTSPLSRWPSERSIRRV